MKLILPSGAMGFFNDEKPARWIFTGSQMGRPDKLPEDKSAPIKLHLRKLKMSACGCYDSGGAYWGQGKPVYMALRGFKCYSPIRKRFELLCGEGGYCKQMFFRAVTRGHAKQIVRKQLPNAKFYV